MIIMMLNASKGPITENKILYIGLFSVTLML